MSKSINLNINVDANRLLDQLAQIVGSIQRKGITDTYPTSDTRFISVLNNDQVISLYYHPTKRHYARAIGSTDTQRSYAEAGSWAYAVAIRSIWGGNKTYYGDDDDGCCVF